MLTLDRPRSVLVLSVGLVTLAEYLKLLCFADVADDHLCLVCAGYVLLRIDAGKERWIRPSEVATLAMMLVALTGLVSYADRAKAIYEIGPTARWPFSRGMSGLGPGLAICKELVDLHGGSLTAASAGTHQGATLTVRLRQYSASPASANDSISGASI